MRFRSYLGGYEVGELVLLEKAEPLPEELAAADAEPSLPNDLRFPEIRTRDRHRLPPRRTRRKITIDYFNK